MRKPKKPRAISSYFLKDFSINHPKLFADKRLLINGVEILKLGDVLFSFFQQCDLELPV